MTQTQYNTDTCAVCKGNHPIFKCSNFLALQPSQRLNKIKQLNGCHDCLKTNHEVTKCPSQSVCKECKRKHNTLLHIVSGSQTFSTKPKGHSLQNIPLQTNNIDSNRNQTENSNAINTVLSATVSGAPTVLLGYLSVAKDPGAYILPHHGVEKPSSSTSLRVVFDASCSTESGSLNDKLLTGPTLQSNITEVILHFRTYAVAMSTEICKMYLQIILHENDRKYQHMFYRFNLSDSITEYELNRVTFGMSASPYLAIRVLLQLIQDEGAAYPLASNALANHTYVDNILTGAHNLNDALALQKELIQLLQKGGFTLKKWASSSTELLKTVPIECHETPIAFSSLENSTIKVLGMQWDPVSDCLSYAVQAPQIILTKRAVLSNIAKLYDPLGYLSPVIFKAKCIMQQTWKINNLKWDDLLPDEIASQWCSFLNQLHTLSQIKIPRCIINKPYKNIAILGFADASKLGYASTIYLRLTKSDNSVSINLLMSKTRLAPISTISIPRLELCAALLLVKTFQSIKPFVSSLEVDKTYLFSDSTVVLDWLKHSPRINKLEAQSNRAYFSA
ncbi:uncharacterized protein LOC123302858 [Chrysoperla carnea]|uniref:uncharacterized protein LOC123302858 n=1 Tax=Chrysoperla carnea TaxID=189513 RepID=UPI001D08322C|nr:uncharacterized protein LOC123302858 [Chrysoperla carnea]